MDRRCRYRSGDLSMVLPSNLMVSGPDFRSSYQSDPIGADALEGSVSKHYCHGNGDGN